MEDILKLAKKLIDSVEFDVIGNKNTGQGGHGGLVSDKTIQTAGELRFALSRYDRRERGE